MSIKYLLENLWEQVKRIRWGWGALFAVYGLVEYFHLFKIFGSTFIGAIAGYVLLLITAKIMSDK